jgi:hypothetical protein
MEDLTPLMVYEILGRKRANRRQVLMPVMLGKKISLSALYLFSLDTVELKVVSVD